MSLIYDDQRQITADQVSHQLAIDAVELFCDSAKELAAASNIGSRYFATGFQQSLDVITAGGQQTQGLQQVFIEKRQLVQSRVGENSEFVRMARPACLCAFEQIEALPFLEPWSPETE